MKNIFIEATLDKYISEYKRVFDVKSDDDLDHGDLGSVFVYYDKTYEVIGSLLNGHKIVLRDVFDDTLCFIDKSYVYDCVKD